MDDHGCIECGQWGHYEAQCPQRLRAVRAAAAAEERTACIAVVMAMATDPGVDWFSGEVLREAAKRLGFRARSTEGGGG